MIVNATYISVWDGDTEIATSCKFDTEKNFVFDIESTDSGINDLDFLDREYICLDNGIEIDTFTTEESRNIVDGELVEEPTCPSCGGTTIKSLGYSYDLAKIFYECDDCEGQGDDEHFR